MAEVKWSGVLSTTEPRNDVGIIKVRQGNVNSEVAEFQIVQRNKPYDLTGLTVYFCANFGLNLVEKQAVVVNERAGKIQYTFDDDSMQALGKQKGYFSIKKEDNKIDSTQDFEYQVESSLMTRSIDGKSYIYKLSALIKILDDFVKNGQKNFNTWFDSVKEILYGVDPGGNILRELIEARKNSSGNIFASLKERLDKNEDDTNRQLAQTDFVSQVSNLIGGYEKMYYKRENSLGWVTVMLRNKKEYVSWAFRNNIYDDFYILGDCYQGEVTESLQSFQDKNYGETSGSWVKTAPNAHYASAVGATMTTYIDGEEYEFHHYSDDRGGIWEFVIDDDTENPITVSTWSASAIPTNNKTIIEGLPYGSHKIVGTFKGDDPLHVPSTGAGTSRGWVYVNGVNNYLTFRSFKTQLSNSRVKDFLVAFSNKEFAFSIRQQGSTAPYQFVPMHNNIGTAFEKQPVKFVADFNVLTKNQINELTIGEFIECEKFSVIQSVYGRNPNSESTNLIEINTNVTISKNGEVEITGKMRPLVNVEIDNGYGIMLPVSKTVATKAISSKGNEYPTTKTDGTSTFLDNESDNTTSFLFVSSEAPDYAVSVRFNDIRNTLRSGKIKGTNIAPYWIEHRDATLQKMYFRPFYKQIITPTDTFKFSATLNCGKIVDVFNIV